MVLDVLKKSRIWGEGAGREYIIVQSLSFLAWALYECNMSWRAKVKIAFHFLKIWESCLLHFQSLVNGSLRCLPIINLWQHDPSISCNNCIVDHWVPALLINIIGLILVHFTLLSMIFTTWWMTFCLIIQNHLAFTFD